MKHSYTHSNKTFSVVALADGSAMEIRRGDRTFRPADTDRGRWASLDAWKATWPAEATPATSSSNAATPKPKTAAPVPNPIISHVLTDYRSNLKLGLPSAGGIRRLKKEIADDEWILNRYYNKPKLETYEVQYRKKLIQEIAKKKTALEGCKHLPAQHAIDTARFGKASVYVSHGGVMMPVFCNKEENVVLIRGFDPVKGRFKTYTPEELGVTIASTFYRQDSYTHVFVPL
jgi:hypothetical protein